MVTRRALTDEQVRYIEWLVDPERSPSTKKGIAYQLGRSEDTLRKWEKQFEFRQGWDARLAELNISPDRKKELVEAIYQQALNGSAKHAELWLKYSGLLKDEPKTVVNVGAEDAKHLTDDELRALIAEEAAKEASNRASG